MQARRRLGIGLTTGVAVVAALSVTAVASPAQQHTPQGRAQQKAARQDLTPRHLTGQQGPAYERRQGPAGARAPGRLKVMTFNAWVGGDWIRGALRKQLAVVKAFRPDVIGMQETRGHSARDLAKRLGWHAWQSRDDLGVVSRFPIDRVTGVTSAGAGVRISLPGGRHAELWTSHMSYRPYGAYDACYGKMSGKRIVAREEQSGRVRQAKEIADEVRGRVLVTAATRTPVIVVGDFNSPSHLDWTAATRRKHCGYGPFDWPVTKVLEGIGLKDSFRVKHPNPVTAPGETWSPVYPRHHGSKGPREPQNRTDYITYAGEDMSVLHSRTVVVGKPKPRPYHRGNAWPSDHKAVMTTFGLD